jgi:hypothetical protein
MKHRKKYYAYVSSDGGATRDVPMQTHNKSELKSYIRSHYGRGWTAHVLAVDLDGDNQSTMGDPYEVETFRLRK